jgi:hypothetical protein
MYNFEQTNYCTPIGTDTNLIYTDCAYALYACMAFPLLIYFYYVYVLGISQVEFYKDINSFFFDINFDDFDDFDDFEVYQDYGLKPLHRVKSYGNLPDTNIKEFQENLKRYLKHRKLCDKCEIEMKWYEPDKNIFTCFCN